MDLPERIKIARESIGKSQKDMANALGASLPSIQNYESGKSVPGGDVVKAFVKLGFNANWLLTGEGEMRRGDKPAVKEAAPGWTPSNGHPASQSERARIAEIGGELVPQPEHERLDRKLLFITIARLQQVFKDFDIDDPQDQAGVITDVYSHIIEKHLDRTDKTVDELAGTVSSMFNDISLLKQLMLVKAIFIKMIPKKLLERFKA